MESSSAESPRVANVSSYTTSNCAGYDEEVLRHATWYLVLRCHYHVSLLSLVLSLIAVPLNLLSFYIIYQSQVISTRQRGRNRNRVSGI